ncbi:exonuclease SbcC [Tepidanaerobacter sp. GT38]|uniref:exonuclease SbcC n=1 Tax=Tepidanaerobacter sp. GT38 TaxID=2722793 RepID=UPI001F2E79DE|nr:exonuclease SbcC [Tepidanaerobacter sp. GT38]MCG1011291.1 exonuclease SbcC [Tepidanaerobacter sp. GT38]
MTDKKIFQDNNTDKSMSEISKNLSTDTVNKFHEIIGERQQQNSQHQNPVQQQFFQEINCLLNSAREQQMSSQKELQTILNQASTNLIDSNRLETLYNSAKQLQQAAQLGIANLKLNIQQYKSMIDKMEKDCHEQQVSTDLQVIQALQQAISCMAQAQNSLLQSQAVDKIYDSITKCQDNLAQIEKLDDTNM